MKLQATSTHLPIVLESIYHGWIVEEILIKFDVNSLRNEQLKWAPRAIGRPHPMIVVVVAIIIKVLMVVGPFISKTTGKLKWLNSLAFGDQAKISCQVT